MKLIVFLISFLVLSMSSLPCCFLEETGKDPLCIVDFSNTEDDHSEKEGCSPFFNCGSCTGFAIQDNIEIGFLPDELSLPIFISYEESFKTAYQHPDFKPPKHQII